MVSLNLYATDTPLWYASPVGPPVEIKLSYNSQSALATNEPFGNKWQFNYASYIELISGGQAVIFMPDGRRDAYLPDGTGGYTRPYAVFNTLVKISQNNFLLAFPDGRVWINPTGSPALAKGGTGDVLCGMIAALLAQHPGLGEHAIAGAVFLHGKAGELAAAQRGEQAVLATDLFETFGEAIGGITNLHDPD